MEYPEIGLRRTLEGQTAIWPPAGCCGAGRAIPGCGRYGQLVQCLSDFADFYWSEPRRDLKRAHPGIRLQSAANSRCWKWRMRNHWWVTCFVGASALTASRMNLSTM